MRAGADRPGVGTSTAGNDRAAPAPPAPAAPAGAAAGPRLTGVTFRRLWEVFLDRQRHIAEGTHELYESYGQYHLLPFFGDTDIALILRTKPLRTADAAAGALYVEDGWLKKMEATPKRDNMGRLRPGTVLSYAYIKKVLTVLGQCFELAIQERPPLLDVNPARGVRLPKQDRREMHFLDDAAAYAALHCAMHVHFRPLLDFLVGTGARYGEAAGLLGAPPAPGHRAALHRHPAGAEVAREKWKLGRPKTRSSIRRILLPPRLVEALRPLVAGKDADDHVFTMVEGGPLHHGNFYNRYWKEAVAAAGTGVPKATRSHDLRHTHAAWLLSAGVPAMVIASRLGHSSTTTTQDVYGHITAEADDRAIDVVDGQLPDVLARGDEGATVLKLTAEEERMPEFDIDDKDDLAA